MRFGWQSSECALGLKKECHIFEEKNNPLKKLRSTGETCFDGREASCVERKNKSDGVGGSCECVESKGEEVKVKDDFSRELEVQLPWLFCSTCVCKVLGGKFA